jgi:DNA recombination protein RmuC
MSGVLVFGAVGFLLGGAAVALAMMMRVTRLTAENAGLSAELAAARRSSDEQRALLIQSQTQLRDAFASLSKEALRENRQDFLADAGALLTPVRETLDKVQGQLVDVDKAREGSYRAVTAQLTELSSAQRELRAAADGLSRSLGSPNARGKWGEIQLRRIVELAGMTAFSDFEEKPTTTTEDGARHTPDLIVRLPGGAVIVVDSKVPIDGYLAAAEARTDSDRATRLAAHLRQVKDHIRALGAKEYWKQFPVSPQFVVMFLPLEPLLGAALEEDRTLLDQAASLNVIPATPITLLALLKTIALGWRQEQLARNAEEIQQIGRELYERLGTLVGHLELVGKNIKQAGDSYDRFVGSLEQKVLPAARRFKELGVETADTIDAPDPLRLTVRPVTRPELLGLAEEIEDAAPGLETRGRDLI